MKIPRDVNAQKLIQLLSKFDYTVTRQTGSHIRLTRKIPERENHLTIPNHNPIRIGTLSNILKDVSEHLQISKEELLIQLFG